LLDDTLVDQIAAGEVIERPANLVKELLENAIDAGATAITVSVEDGGRAHVRVVDDGIGMSPEDAKLAIERHATSKIASFDDLVRVETLGFRGEALPSIGSVAKMTITTRQRDALEGTRVVVEGGALQEVAPVGCPPGTSVDVDDLFYNVPARKKFLRARQTEASRIYETCQRVALSHPELRLVVTSEGRTVRRYLPARDLVERAGQVFREIPLEHIEARREDVTLDAALAPAEHARPGTRQLYLMVNGRPVNDRGLARAIAFAFGDTLQPGHYPRGVVALELPPEDVDVNAHPQKTEIRFRRAAHLLDLVTRMLAGRLPASVASASDAYWNARIGGAGPEVERRPIDVSRVAETRAAFPTLGPDSLRLVATVRESVLVCESVDEVVVIDRARADAVRRAEALRGALQLDSAPRQSLLFPDRLTVDPLLRASMDAHAGVLHALGFDWSELGGGVVAVREVPEALSDAPGNVSLEAALRELGTRPQEPAESLCRSLGEVAAVPPGEALDAERTSHIVAAIRLSNPVFDACILSRHPLPPGHAR
jgi:DNA mismatch repair protein MutL